MAYAHVQSKIISASAVTTLSAAFASAVVAGNRIIAGKVGSTGVITATCADNASGGTNTYTKDLDFDDANNFRDSQFSAPIQRGGGSALTVTITLSASDNADGFMAEYSGIDSSVGAGAVDTSGHNFVNGAATSFTMTASPNPAAANEAAIGFMDCLIANAYTATAGTIRTQAAAVNGQAAIMDRASVAGTTTLSGTMTADGNAYHDMMVVYKLAAAGSADDPQNFVLEAPAPPRSPASRAQLYWQPAHDSVSAPVTTTGKEETDFVLKANPRTGPRGRVVNSDANIQTAPVTASGLEQTDFVEVPNKNLGPRGRALNTDATDTASAPVAITTQADTSFVLKANVRLGPRGRVFNSAAMDPATAAAIIDQLDTVARPNPNLGPRGRTINTTANDTVSAPITVSRLEQTDFALKPNARLGPTGRALSTPATDTSSAPITSSAFESVDFALKPNVRIGPRGRTLNTDATDIASAQITVTGLEDTNFVLRANPRVGPRGRVFNDLDSTTPVVAPTTGFEDQTFVLRPNRRLGPRGFLVTSLANDLQVVAPAGSAKDIILVSGRLAKRITDFIYESLEESA